MDGMKTVNEMRVIHLVGKHSKARMKRIENADIVIDKDGQVVKHRYGYAQRAATKRELELAVKA